MQKWIVNYQYKKWTMERKQELMYNTQMKKRKKLFFFK